MIIYKELEYIQIYLKHDVTAPYSLFTTDKITMTIIDVKLQFLLLYRWF